MTKVSCKGARCGSVCKVPGVVLVRGENGSGMGFIEPSSVTSTWALCLGPPLMSPHSKYSGCLGSIFTGSRQAPLFSYIGGSYHECCGMAQCGGSIWVWEGRCNEGDAQGVFRAYTTALHDVQATVKAVYSLSYHLPTTQAGAARVLAMWLKKHTYWWGDTCSSRYLASDFAVQSVTGV